MAGKAIALTARDKAILADVAELQLVARPQLERLGHFGSRTRANAVLARLAHFRYLSVRRQPLVGASRRLLYTLGPLGVHATGLDPRQARRIDQLSELFVEHHLRITDVRLEFSSMQADGFEYERWIAEGDLRRRSLGFVPDGYVEYRHFSLRYAAFIEVDLGTETLARIEEKTRAYLAFASSGAFTHAFERRYFRVLLLAPTPSRLSSLRSAVGKVTDKVFWLTTLAELAATGPLSTIWRRPQADGLHSLTEGA